MEEGHEGRGGYSCNQCTLSSEWDEINWGRVELVKTFTPEQVSVVQSRSCMERPPTLSWVLGKRRLPDRYRGCGLPRGKGIGGYRKHYPGTRE